MELKGPGHLPSWDGSHELLGSLQTSPGHPRALRLAFLFSGTCPPHPETAGKSL